MLSGCPVGLPEHYFVLDDQPEETAVVSCCCCLMLHTQAFSTEQVLEPANSIPTLLASLSLGQCGSAAHPNPN
jgi:hypothetical protein